jgi:hypothetical protein
MSVVEITFPGNLAQVETIADLRALPSANMENGELYAVADAGLYAFDTASVAVDDGVTVLKPNDLSPLQAGRWLLNGSSYFIGFSQLAAPSGSSLVKFIQAGTGAAPRTVEARLRDRVSARDFGAIGDDATHPLSERFATLAAAQAVYPFVTSLTQTLDYAGIQAAINFVEPYGGTVFIPSGPGGKNRYRISDTLLIPSFVTIEGDGTYGTIIDNQNYPVTGGIQLSNKYPDSCNFITLRNLVFHGSAATHTGLGVGVTISCEGWQFENVRFLLHATANISVNKLLQTSSFRNCVFGDAQYGVSVSAFTTNAVDFINCSWERITRTCLYLRSAEGVNIIGGRMEAGGGSGFSTLDFTNAGAVNISGVYFENTSGVLLTESASRGGVSFLGCHMTGWTPPGGGLAPYSVVSDGVVTFRDCEVPLGLTFDGMAQVTGTAGQQIGDPSTKLLMSRARGHQHVISGELPLTAAMNLLVFTRAGASGATSNIQSLAGKLTLSATFVSELGAVSVFAREWLVAVAAVGSAPMTAKAGAYPITAETNTDPAITVTPGAMGTPTNTSLTFGLTIAGLPAGVPTGSIARWEFCQIDGTTLETDRIKVAMA